MNTSLGQRIIYYRKKAGISRKRLAEIIEIAYDTLRRYENDEREPNILALIRIAKELNITVDTLVGLEPHRNHVAQNSDESAILQSFRSLNKLGRDRMLMLVSWLSETPKCVDPIKRIP